jgi:hypothetical protein
VYLHIALEGGEQTILYTAGAHTELHEQFITVGHGKPQWSTRAYVHTVCKIEPQDCFSFAILEDEFPDKSHLEWTKQVIPTAVLAMGLYVVDEIAESSF